MILSFFFFYFFLSSINSHFVSSLSPSFSSYFLYFWFKIFIPIYKWLFEKSIFIFYSVKTRWVFLHSQWLLSFSDELVGKGSRGGKVTEEPHLCSCKIFRLIFTKYFKATTRTMFVYWIIYLFTYSAWYLLSTRHCCGVWGYHSWTKQTFALTKLTC